jgi:hypothetical protein
MTITVTNGKIDGRITVHAPGGTQHSRVNGTFDGTTITFGAIRGFTVTFTGKLIGDTTAGTYKANDGTGDHGVWSANRA